MIALALYLASLIGSPPASPSLAGRRCEEVGPRLDRTYVTICDGTVVRVRDQLGNVRTWNRGRDTVNVQLGARAVELGR